MKKKLLFIFLFLIVLINGQADCTGAIAACGNSTINYTPIGIGNVNEPVGGCLSGEHNSVWYKFTIATSGTLTFDLIPADLTVDYDWAVYGPNTNCSNLGSPIRCNAATAVGVGGATGLNMTSTITSGAGGSTTPYCKYMDVLAGQTYYLYIDNWVSATVTTMSPFSLNWGGTATLASPFTDPVITPHPFVPPGTPGANPGAPSEIVICAEPTVFNFNTLSNGIVNGNANFQVTYHTNSNDAISGNSPIMNPISVGTTAIYYYSIHYNDPTNPNNPINSCRNIGSFKFKLGSIKANNATLTACNNNNTGTAVFDLTTANVIVNPTVTKKYYETLNDLNSGINAIANPNAFVSAAGTVYVKITTPEGCSDVAIITLSFFPVVVVNDAIMRTCFTEGNPSLGLFDLTTASVTLQTGTTKKYYPSLADAVNSTNEIPNPAAYIAPNGVVFVKVLNTNGCYTVAKITLTVFQPVYSSVLVDKIICAEDTTTLDAGAGFTGYEWSTGATTQTISNVGIGTYWVKLKTGDCITKQEVKVYASEQPVITNVEINNTTIAVQVTGGSPAYKYSLDQINWQDSNIFTIVNRGEYVVYVKDSYDCDPQQIDITVPNLVNVITPNGDGTNDVLDYSALSNKQNLEVNIYNRYGDRVFQLNKSTNYKWDGTSGGKKLPTGNYWYSVSWNENNKKNTSVKYTGWIMVKNRD
ncbi:MAG: gliding motility-associated C-terminal domain-containing protein [Chryseobacterium sp.]|nr:gliding motility-associated C-terminal domain-containing protein [Candidatus Chryseobacterium enterohippi]